MTDVSSTSPSAPSQEHSNGDANATAAGKFSEPLPTFLWLLLGFLLADTILRLAQVGTLAHEEGTKVFEKRFLHLVTATFSLLLAVQLWFRTFAARIWGSAYFILQVVYFVSLYGIRRPEEWLALSGIGRVQAICQLLFFLVALVLLNSRPASRVLAPRPIYGWIPDDQNPPP